MFSAGQIRDRARLLKLRAAEEVARVRPELSSATAAYLLSDSAASILPDKLFTAPPVMTDGFLFPRTPERPRTLPNLSLFHDRLPMLAPEASRNEVLDETPLDQLMSLPPSDDVAPVADPSLVDVSQPWGDVGDADPMLVSGGSYRDHLTHYLKIGTHAVSFLSSGEVAARAELARLRAESEDQVFREILDVMEGNWSLAQELWQAPTRLDMVTRAATELTSVYDALLQELLTGQTTMDPAFRRRLFVLGVAYRTLVSGVDNARQSLDPTWQNEADKPAIHLMHDGPMRITSAFITAGEDLAARGVSQERAWLHSSRRLAGGASVTRGEGLATAVYAAVLQNVIFATARGVSIEVNVPPDLEIPKDSKGPFTAQITELINNSIKYQAKEIVISWDAAVGALLVRDDGVGIADPIGVWENKAREERVQAEGEGRGLAFVREEFAKLGYEISVESMVGKGSVFSIRPMMSVPPQLSDLELVQQEIDEAIELLQQVRIRLDYSDITLGIAIANLRNMKGSEQLLGGLRPGNIEDMLLPVAADLDRIAELYENIEMSSDFLPVIYDENGAEHPAHPAVLAIHWLSKMDAQLLRALVR